MNGYQAFYCGKTAQVNAITYAQAQEFAAIMFSATNSGDVTVMLTRLAPAQLSTAGI
jgi:hypothetical protein